MMISFIVIGRNEGWKLTKCLESVFDTIKHNAINNYEIIYVDSMSTDNSIERAKQFKNIRVFKITGTYNSAIARNIGAKESKGEILFFIDGDIELIPSFLERVIDSSGKLKYESVSGYLDNVFYDVNHNLLGRAPGSYQGSLPTTEKVLIVNGGIFLIKRSWWELVNGMKNKYKKNQDLDFTLRLSEKGVKSIRIPALMGLHHTVDYRNDKRMWHFLLNGSAMYPALTTRDHLFNFKKIVHTLRRQYTGFLLIVALGSLFISTSLSLFFFSIYTIILFLKVMRNTLEVKINSKWKGFYFFERVAYQIVHDLVFWLSFLFFFPKSHTEEYIEIN